MQRVTCAGCGCCGLGVRRGLGVGRGIGVGRDISVENGMGVGRGMGAGCGMGVGNRMGADCGRAHKAAGRCSHTLSHRPHADCADCSIAQVRAVCVAGLRPSRTHKSPSRQQR
eukprot:225107-Chlamydomonas_euryale.AAC.1